MDTQIGIVKFRIDMCLKVIRMYDWLLDMYVLDFFVDNHWDKLPSSWKYSFQNLDPQKLGSVICGKTTSHVYPLSFLALLQTVQTLCIPRQTCTNTLLSCELSLDKYGYNSKLKNLFLKHVKLKKRHEISLMADVVKDTAQKSHCDAVVDFGSGLGHLVRVLGYKYHLYAAGIECQMQLIENARKMDLELEYTAAKHLSPIAMSELRRPVHFNMTLTSFKQLSDLPLPETMKNYGLVGLHPCGDLGPLLLKHFIENEKVKFICLVGCCFMKLTPSGYPMSSYVKSCDSHLSYVTREISCHAIERYCDRLIKGNYEDLKVHTFRATLESILIEIDPKLKHAPIRSIKHSDNMTFERYCSIALDKVPGSGARDTVLGGAGLVPEGAVLSAAGAAAAGACTRARLAQWRRVLTVYSLRLALAPLIETLILLDRQLFSLEKGISCEIRPVFDPMISPRNHIMIARR